MASPTELFAKRLTSLFESIEGKLLADTRAYYEATARAQFNAWEKLLAGPEPDKANRNYRLLLRPAEYVRNSTGVSNPTWEGLTAAHARGEWVCDLDRAARDAEAFVKQTKLGFVAKYAKKLGHATRLREDEPREISGTLSLNQAITGALRVVYRNGDEFELSLNIITNYRNGRPYLQFPGRFRFLNYGGKRSLATSERWLAENFR